MFHKRLQPVKVLILNEFGYVSYDRIGTQLLFDYVSEVEGKKVIILNTNQELSKWTGIFYDQNMTAAFIGRITNRAHIILFPGKSHREPLNGMNPFN